VITDESYELRNRSQYLVIKVVQPEHEGMFSCLVENEVGTEQAEGNLTIGGKNANYNSEREELPFI
jgi:hypothetical protein